MPLVVPLAIESVNEGNAVVSTGVDVCTVERDSNISGVVVWTVKRDWESNSVGIVTENSSVIGTAVGAAGVFVLLTSVMVLVMVDVEVEWTVVVNSAEGLHFGQ
jgi:hypothetical protein